MLLLIFYVWIWGFLLAPPAIIAVIAIKILITRYRVKSLIAYCGIDMIDALRADPERAARMITEKLNEVTILLGYRNERLKKQMKDAGIIEEADDYGYDKITRELHMVKFPENEEMETVKIEFIDFRFANLRAKSEKIRQVFEAKELLKKALVEHCKMVGRFMKS